MADRMVFLMMVALVMGGLQIAAGQYSCSTTEITAQAVEDCVNAVRSNPGQYANMCGAAAPVNTLWSDPALTQAAAGHSSYMASTGAFAHGDFSGRIRSAGFQGGAIAENIANGHSSAYDVVSNWMCSPGHRNNLVGCNYDSMGTGVDCSGGSCYTTQTYGCSSGNCCGGGGRGPAPTAVAGAVDEVVGATGGIFGGTPLVGRLFGTTSTPLFGGLFSAPAPAPPAADAAPAGNDCVFRIFCRFG